MKGFIRPIRFPCVEKKRIEDLSNLVFGLALTLGAISLTGPQTDDLGSLINTIAQFGLSFAVIIWIWWLYNNLIDEQHLVRRGMIQLNIILLFLVVIEPFLLSVSQPFSSGRIAYSFDLGLTLLIFAVFNNVAISDEILAPTETQRQRLRFNRNLTVGCAAIFFVSLIPQFLLGADGANIQSAMWLSALFIGGLGRRWGMSRISRNAPGESLRARGVTGSDLALVCMIDDIRKPFIIMWPSRKEGRSLKRGLVGSKP